MLSRRYYLLVIFLVASVAVFPGTFLNKHLSVSEYYTRRPSASAVTSSSSMEAQQGKIETTPSDRQEFLQKARALEVSHSLEVESLTNQTLLLQEQLNLVMEEKRNLSLKVESLTNQTEHLQEQLNRDMEEKKKLSPFSSLGEGKNESVDMLVTSPENAESDALVVRHGQQEQLMSQSIPSRMDMNANPTLNDDTKISEMLTLWKTLWLDRIPQDDQRPKWNMNSTEFMNMTIGRLHRIANGTDIAEEMDSLFQTLETPSRQNSTSLYNEAAYNDLISNLLQSHIQGRNFTIAACGGSSTAGGQDRKPGIPKEKRFYSMFADMLNAVLPPTNRTGPTVVSTGQGHGTRNSFHSTILLDNFVPLDTDLLLWEFAINDASGIKGPKVADLIQMDLLAFLHEVASRKKPPKVVLVFLWDAPYGTYRWRPEFIVRKTAFEALHTIGRQFDFVMGHVNVAGYIEESFAYPECRSRGTCPFLADQHHPSKIGHLITTFQLFNLMDPSKQSLLPPEHNRTHSDVYKHEWLCGTETPEKQILKQVITNSSTGWKPPLGSWTLELPTAEDYSSSRRLIPGQPIVHIQVNGRKDPIRQDRQRLTPLPDCGSDASKKFSIVAPHEPMKDVRVMLLNFGQYIPMLNTSDISIHINNSSTATNGTLVPVFVHVKAPNVPAWECNFGRSWGGTVQTYFHIFEEPISVVQSVGLCSDLKPVFQSIALW